MSINLDVGACTSGALTMTKSNVHLKVLADCPFSIAHDYATDYPRRAGTDFSFGVRNDTNERGRSHDELSVAVGAPRATAAAPINKRHPPFPDRR